MSSSKPRKPVNSVDGMATRPQPKQAKLSRKKSPKFKLPLKLILLITIGIALAWLSTNFIFGEDTSQQAEDSEVAAVVDSPFDEQRKEDLQRLKTAIQLYLEAEGQLPSHAVVSSKTFINEYLGEFLHPDGQQEYAIGVYSTDDRIIGYALNTICEYEIGGTTPSNVGGYFTLHIITEDKQFYCLDNTSS